MSSVWIWLWEISECEHGDLLAIAAKAKAHHVGVMVKTHDGATANPNGHAGVQLVDVLRRAGVPVRAWGYCYPNIDPGLQTDFAAMAGVDYIADVEVEWDGHRQEAAAFVDALRAKLVGRLVGYAPLPIVSYHDGAGQYEEFNRLDVACPQAYAGTGGRDAIGALTWTAQEWGRAFARCNVEPAVYAADQPASDLRAAIAQVSATGRTFGNGDVSVWSWQHMTPEHWAVIEEFTHGGSDMAITRDEYIEVDPATGMSGEDLVKATSRVLFVAEFNTIVQKEIASAAAASDDDSVNRALAIVGRAFSSAASSLVPPPPADHPDWLYAGENADGTVIFYRDPAGAIHNVTKGAPVT